MIQIEDGGKWHSLGHFDEKEAAAEAYTPPPATNTRVLGHAFVSNRSNTTY